MTRQATMGGIRSMRSAVTAFAMATAHLVRTVAAGDADRPWARDRGEGSPRVVADMRIQVGSGCVSARSHRWRHSTSRADRPPLLRCECMAVPRLRAGASRFVRMRPGHIFGATRCQFVRRGREHALTRIAQKGWSPDAHGEVGCSSWAQPQRPSTTRRSSADRLSDSGPVEPHTTMSSSRMPQRPST